MSDRSLGVVPGSGVALVHGLTVVLVEGIADDTAAALWDVLAAGGDGNDVIAELSATGLRDLGPFAVAQIEGDGVRFFVRGRASVNYRTVDGTGTIEGADVRTWVEQVVGSCASFDVALEQIDAASIYRLVEGVVPAVSLSWNSAGRTDAVSTPPLPATQASTPASGSRGDATELLADHEPVSASWTEPEPEPAVGEADDDEPASSEWTDPEPAVPEHTLQYTVEAAESAPFEAGAAGQEPTELPLPPASVTDPPVGADDLKTAVPDATVEEAGDGADLYDYDALFGHTTHKSVQDAAVAIPEPEEIEPEGVGDGDAPPAEAIAEQQSATTEDAVAMISAVPQAASPDVGSGESEDLGDHDGLTMSVEQLRALRESSGSAGPDRADAPGGPTVQALSCPAGHPNPTSLDLCRRCGASLPPRPVTIPRPRLGRIRLSTGDTIELDRSAIVGRNPRISGTMQGEVPATVKLEGNQALSRSHVMVRLEGWQVMLEDLDSANGTTVTLQGRLPQRLRAGEPVLLEHGATIDLGGEVTGTYDAFE